MAKWTKVNGVMWPVFGRTLKLKLSLHACNQLRFECHSILQKLSYNRYIDEDKDGAECGVVSYYIIFTMRI